jgi:uncharacterized protein
MNTAWIIVLIIAVSLLAFYLGLLYFLARCVAYPHLFSTEDTIVIEKFKDLYFSYDEYQKEEVEIKSFDGYIIRGTYVRNSLPSDKYVIITHGNTYTRYGSLKYLDLFYKEGYNILIYDDRGHGENKKAVCTMGIKESRDLISIIDYMHQRFGKDIYLGLHGESMGAGISLMALKYKPQIAFVVADCPYAYLDDVLAHQLKIHYHLPGFFVRQSGLICRLFFGYDFCKVRPEEAIEDNYVPICFMHGTSDTFINCSHSEKMAKITKGYQEVHLYSGAEHAQSFPTHQEEYRKDIHAFLSAIKKTDPNQESV